MTDAGRVQSRSFWPVKPEDWAQKHGPRIFRNSEMDPDYRWRAECWCGWGNDDDKRGSRYYATERAAKIGLSLHMRKAS